jgi:hypothetical protein
VTTYAKVRRLRARRTAAGQCWDCGCQWAGASPRCDECRRVAAEKSRQRYLASKERHRAKCGARERETRAARRAAGECVQCGADSEGRYFCDAHRAAARARSKKYAAATNERLRAMRQRWKAAGMCSQCGKPPRPGKTKCAHCAALGSAREMKRQGLLSAAGKCRRCKAPVTRYLFCRRCREWQAIERRERKNAQNKRNQELQRAA